MPESSSGVNQSHLICNLNQLFMMKQILILTLIFLSIRLQSQNLEGELIGQLNSQVEQYIDGFSPGIAVGIVADGNVVYEDYFGYSNLELQVKVDKDTRFNIASNAKQFTALCILKLLDQGKIQLEDDIRIYFPDLYENIEEKFTISNLLTHTSGVRDYCDLLALQGKTWWKQFIDNGDAMDLLQAQRDLNFEPGTEYLYSNSNYILLAELVEKVTGQDFSAFAKTLFEALEMPSTDFLSHYGQIIPNKARPYGNWGVWREEPTITEVHGDGALFTTLQDQLRWEQIIQRNDGKHLSKEIIEASQIPLENDYGYGLEFDNRHGLDYTFHDGATGAYNATFLRFPSKNLSIVVMSNNRNVPANYLAWQLAILVMDIEQDETVYPAGPDKVEELYSIQDVLGIYKNDDGTIIRITERDGSLYREIYQRDPVKLIHEQGGLFAYETLKDLKMNFTHMGTPDQMFTLYLSSQKPATYHKVSDLIPDSFDKNAVNGRFYNDETDTEIILEFVEDDTYALTKNGRERRAEMILKDFLRMNSYEIQILRDKENNITGLNVNNRRIKNVLFDKT